MVFVLRDDRSLDVFESPAEVPGWIEGLDIGPSVLDLCDDRGQRYAVEEVRVAVAGPGPTAGG